MNDVVLQSASPPPREPARLFLLFHGLGASPQDLQPLGEVLAARWPRAGVVSVQSPDPCELAAGWQWFSVTGITEANRTARIAQALPRFLAKVDEWQRHQGANTASTVLLGFSQGAMMSLASTASSPPPANRVVAIAGRFADLPTAAPADVALHLFHGEQDAVVPARHSVEAAARWRELGGQVTLDLFPALGHGIDGRVVQRLLERLAAIGD